MNTCSDHRETLFLDVHEELTPDERSIWEKHLAVCEDCQRERKKLVALIQKSKETCSSSSLSSEEEQLMSSRVQRRLRMGKPDAVYKRLGWRIAPALGACVIILFAGWFSLNDFSGSDTLSVNSDKVPEEQIIINNEELLDNMELLQEMESLEQLVNLLDKQSLETSLLEGEGSENHV
jgi:hypothetical protein